MNKRLIKYSYLIFIISFSLTFAQNAGEYETGQGFANSSYVDSFKKAGDFSQNYSVLNIPFSISFENVNLTRILNYISKETGAKLIYDSQLLNIQGITIQLQNVPLYTVLDQLLNKYDISYFEYEPGEIALAKRTSIAERTGGIKGIVTNSDGEILPAANVILKEINIGAAADSKGNYVITNINPGEYTLEVSFIGHEKYDQKIRINGGEILEINVTLKVTAFLIGGVQVIGTSDFIPLSPETKTKVTSGQIEHIQASSLNDVMKLTPGVKTSNPTLNTIETASIRGGEAIGTQVVMDGIPITNNANMQVGAILSTVNGGLDLRSIPAENIKEVDVIRGIPSAQYGDLTDGLLIVKTKSKPHSPLIKIKYNPDLYETNFSSGYQAGDWVLNGNLNIASSDRDYKVQGDGYTRIAGQASAEIQTEKMQFKNNFFITRTFDEKKETPGASTRAAWYNRDLQLRYSNNFSYAWSTFSEFRSNISVGFTNQDSYSQELVSRDNIIISDRFTEGAQDGHIVFGTYLGKKWIKGEAWNLFADANYKLRFFTNEFLHTLLTGVEWRNDFNKGDGIIFDPLFPPSLSVPSPRIRTYSDIPSYNILSLYAEDKITGRLFRPFTLQAGFRYEVYRPDGFNIQGLWGDGDLIESKNGSFLNPRVNFSFKLFDNTQLRAGYGVTTKSPTLGMIYAQDKYYDIVDTNSVVSPQYPDSNFAIISTYIKKQANDRIQAYKQKKYEVSIDQQIGDIGIAVTGFINNSTGEFKTFPQPAVFYKKRYPDWPDQSTAVPYDTLLDTYLSYVNDGWRNTKGIELLFQTPKIPFINTIFKMDAAYIYGEYGSSSGYNFGVERTFGSAGISVLPMYNSYSSYYKDLLINYWFDIQAESLGLWLTIQVQQQLIEINGRIGEDDTLAIAYFTTAGELIRIPETDRGNPEYAKLARNIEDYELLEEDKPNKWLINLRVTKSLWKGAAISFYVNNLFNNRPLYASLRTNGATFERRNPEIFYGIELHSSLTGLFK